MRARIWKERFAIVRVEKIPPHLEAFAIIRDKKELTIILRKEIWRRYLMRRLKRVIGL
jgi:hypothetical protein